MSFSLITLIISILILLPLVTRIYLLNPKNPMHRAISLAGFMIGALGILEYEIAHTTSLEKVQEMALFHTTFSMSIIYLASTSAYYFSKTASVVWKKVGFILNIVLLIPPFYVVYQMFVMGIVMDTNHQIIDGKWGYTINQEENLTVFFGIWFLVMEIYLSMSHFIAYYYTKQKKERFWKLVLFFSFTIIPFFVIYQFIYAVDESNLGEYNITPYLTILIIVISWIYTNFKLFEINPIAAIDNILEYMSNIIIITDSDFKIIYTNEAFERFGTGRKYFINKSFIDLAKMTGNIAPENFDLLRKLKSKERRERMITFNIKGKIYHLLMTAIPTHNDQDVRIGYVFVLTDLTETIETRNKLKEYTIELEQSNKELERFAYIASHDMKTPLRNIVSFLGLIERKLKNYDDQDVHEFIGFASSNARYMHSLVQDILEFSKISKIENSFVSVDLHQVVLNNINHLSKYIEEKQAMIEFEELPIITVNETQIHQLFQNLIENGIKYNESEQPIVKIYSKQLPDKICIIFEDNGIGISENFQDQIFEMFKRLHNNTSYQGTGIGLAICKKIVTIHGGNIYVEKAIPQGSKFIVELPINLIVRTL